MKTIGKIHSKFFLSLLLVLFLTLTISCSDERINSFGLEGRNLVISKEKDGAKTNPPIFSAGEVVYIRFEFSEYDVDSNGLAWIQEDIIMIRKDGAIILNKPNIIDAKIAPPAEAEWWPVHNKITLPEVIQPGEATIEINVRDKIGGGTISIKTTIEVK